MSLRSTRAAAAAALLLAAAVGAAAGWHRAHSPFLDWLQRAFPRSLERVTVTVVAVDEASLAALGRWPWPRTLTARLVSGVKALRPLAIGLDFVMPEPDRLTPSTLLAHHPDVDPALLEALARLGSNDVRLAEAIATPEVPVVAGIAGHAEAGTGGAPPPGRTPYRVGEGTSLDRVPLYAGMLRNVEPIERAAAGHGLLNASPDPDAVVRRIPLVGRTGEHLHPALATELLRVVQGAAWFEVAGDPRGLGGITVGDLSVPTDRAGAVRPRLSASDPRRYLSAHTVLRGDAPAGALEGQIALIGVTGLGLADAPPTAVAARMNGVEIQAQLLESLIDGELLARPAHGVWVEVLAGVLAGAVLIVCLPWTGSVIGLGLGLALAAGLGGASAWALASHRLLLDALPAVGYLGVAYLVMSAGLLLGSERARRHLHRALEEERVRRARVEGELGAAREIQQGILPDTRRVALPAGASLHAFLDAASEVGGDLYDVARLDDDRLFLVLGDVSGKGVPASLFMAVSKTLCKSTALRGGMGAGAILTQASREIARENPTALFVTAVAVIVDLPTGALEVSVAGHEAPLVARPGHPPRRIEDAGGPPLCVIEDFEYPSVRDRLGPGETLVLVTDGVTEAADPEGALYGSTRLIEALAGVGENEDAEAVTGRLRHDLAAFTRGAPPSDDVAVLAFQAAGSAAAGERGAGGAGAGTSSHRPGGSGRHRPARRM